MTLHIFNPENDLALACPSPHFIPPASARQMADDLSALPVWWAMRGDAVCVASVKEARRWAEEAGGICPEVRWVGRDGLPSDADVDPWGWSPLMVQRLLTGVCPMKRVWRVTVNCRTAVMQWTCWLIYAIPTWIWDRSGGIGFVAFLITVPANRKSSEGCGNIPKPY